MDPQRPADEIPHEMARIERGEGILEDELAVAAEVLPGRPADPVAAVGRLQRRQPVAVRLASALFRDGEKGVQAVAVGPAEAEIDGASRRRAAAADAPPQGRLPPASLADEIGGTTGRASVGQSG